MAGKKYTAKDKVVTKMTRDGLVNENLRQGTRENVPKKDGKQQQKTRSRIYPDDETNSDDETKEEMSDVKEDQTSKQPRRNSFGEPPIRAAPLLRGNVAKETMADRSDEMAEGDVPKRPSKMANVKAHSVAMDDVKEEPDTAHLRKKKQVQTYHRKDVLDKLEEDLSEQKEHLQEKVRKQRIYTEQKRSGRLKFDEGKPHSSKTMDSVKHTTGTVISATVHGKIHEEEEENLGVKSVHSSELAMETAARSLRAVQESRMKKAGYSKRLRMEEPIRQTKSRLNFGVHDPEKDRGTGFGKDAREQGVRKKESIRKFWQKKRIKQSYAAAKSGQKATEEAIKATETVTVKAKRMMEEIVRRNKGIFSMGALLALLFLIIASTFGSCAAVVQGGGTTVISTTYAAEDSEIYAVENAYSSMETALNQQINSMESAHPGYDEFQYQIDEISHNPYHLISYFTVKYGDFTYQQVKDELEEIFREQYSLNTEGIRRTVTETKTVRVGESLGNVVTSGYCNCSICCGQWSGGPTASGVMPTPNHTLAVDATNPFVPLGTKVIMNGVEYVVEDTGAFARYGVQFDVYYGDHASASAHGHQTWECFLADDNGGQEVEVTVTRDVNQFNVSLTNHSLDAVLRSRMSEEEEKRYGYYNLTYGNRDYLFDTHTLPTYGGGGFGYQIPSEALSDERFARMIGEAEKYLRYPYVWGGASPETSFDCSGFVSWVINNCGNGWNVGRQTADGLRSCCAQVSPSNAKPGDLIFFQGTYDTPGASHVGIYVGDGMMIHCGNPIQYTSINSAYWQQHFMAFGRLP